MEELKLLFRGPTEQRLDRFLAASLPAYSRARLQRLIRQGMVRVGGNVAEKAGQILEVGAEILVQIPPTAPSRLLAEKIQLAVVFENRDVILVNKPAGMVVHPGAGHQEGTLVNAVLGHDPTMAGIGGEQRPGLVHRLDKDTSGLVVLAKNETALGTLQEQFQARSVRKTYLALVDGRPPTRQGRIEAPIARDATHRKRMSVASDGRGREAATEYLTLEEFKHHTLLQLHPLTGRTHQVRLHCAFLGTPVAGDIVYGRKRATIDLDRHFLHASRIRFVLPGERQPREFLAAMPPELERVLAELRA